MKSQHVTWTLLMLGSAAAIAGCGGGGGGGSDSADGGTAATIMLANSSSMENTEDEEIDSADPRFGFGWRQVRSRDILSLTVSITEVYFQYCEDMSPGDSPEVVLVSDSEFDPSSITVKRGDTVRWEWTTDAEHTITSGLPGSSRAGELFDETASGTGAVVELTFADCGVFPYFSNTEADVAAGMSGMVRVKQINHHHDNVVTGDTRHGGHQLGERVMIFTGSFDIDLLNLTDLSQILTTADIPAAEYCRIFIRIDDPRLVLKSDPETVITNVRLTSNGRLFLREHFEIAEGEEILVLLDFGGIHLFRSFSGDGYVLSPRLKADIRVIDGDVEIEGVVSSINPSQRSFEVETIDTEVFEVFVDRKTSILTDDDSDDGAPTGAVTKLRFSSLLVGQQVEVLGTTDSSGGLDADAVEVGDDDIDTTL
jgi:plastocyanin